MWSKVISDTPIHCGHPSSQLTALITYILLFTITHNFLTPFALALNSIERF